MYAKVVNGQVVQFPYTVQELYAANPNTTFSGSLTDEILAIFDMVRVVVTGAPEHNPITQKAVQQGCAYSAERSRWEQTWQILDKTDDELASETAEKAAQVRSTRNNRLANSDWTQVLDAPVDKSAWATYRQALRDVTDQTGFPWEVVWPQEP